MRASISRSHRDLLTFKIPLVVLWFQTSVLRLSSIFLSQSEIKDTFVWTRQRLAIMLTRLKSCGSVLRIGGPILWVEINKGDIGGEDASRNDKNLEKNFREMLYHQRQQRYESTDFNHGGLYHSRYHESDCSEGDWWL